MFLFDNFDNENYYIIIKKNEDLNLDKYKYNKNMQIYIFIFLLFFWNNL